MTSTSSHSSLPRLRTAVVLGTTEEECTVVQDEQVRVVPYARPFPAPRAERVSPGHLVATATTPAVRTSSSGGGSTPWCSTPRATAST
jgi:hypothetical protein